MASKTDRLKLFAMTSQLIEHDLDQVEREHAVDLRRDHKRSVDVDESYYPQIGREIRAEAAEMAPHYEVFYSLERFIRRTVAETLEAAQSDWWDQCVPSQIRQNAKRLQKEEKDKGVTPRSDDPLDFTNFGELGQIINANWDVFGAVFSTQKAVERVMANLNTLRAPIAHCSPLAEDEVVRLRLTVRDWFRLSDRPST